MFSMEDLTRIRQTITAAFDEEEIRTLCFDLDIDHASLGGEGREGKVRELVAFCRRMNQMQELLSYCRQARPQMFEFFASTPNSSIAQPDLHFGKDLSLVPIDEIRIRTTSRQLQDAYEMLKEYEMVEHAMQDPVARAKWRTQKENVLKSIRALQLQLDLLVDPNLNLQSCPFKGLHYYDVQDSQIYFGRESLVNSLVKQLRKVASTDSRVLAIVGPSGIGKSSLVRAGLIPAINPSDSITKPNSRLSRSSAWPIYLLTPSAHPLKNLAACLTQDSSAIRETAMLMEDLANDERTLDLFVHKMVSRSSVDHIVIVVDQFEEIFFLCQDDLERRAFINNLIVAATNDVKGPTIIIIALRADFYHHCAQYENLRQSLTEWQEYIGPMSQIELRRAIEEPATRAGLKFEDDLVERLLHDIGDEPGALPLLSHALQETWYRRQNNMLTHDGYREAGRVRGAIAKTADDIFDSLSLEQQKVARNIFVRLTEFGDGATYTRRKVELSEFTSIANEGLVQEVLNRLASARLITVDSQSVEVAHEILVREWPQLRQWLDENQELLRSHRRLTVDSVTWHELGNEPSELYRGERLARALRWAETNDQLNALEREFLAQSKVAEYVERIALEQSILEKERRRFAQELHNSVSQRLDAVLTISRQLKERIHSPHKSQIDKMLEMLSLEAVQGSREVRLAIYRLLPPDLEELGLTVALRQRLNSVEERSGMRTSLEVHGDVDAIPLHIVEHVFFIIQESLNNALRHSGGTEVHIHLSVNEDMLFTSIHDNGHGFEVANTHNGFGLTMIEERVQALGGSLSLNGSVNSGTSVEVSVGLGPSSTSLL